MNTKQALAQARKRWGKKAVVQDIKLDTSPERREQARKRYAELKDLKGDALTPELKKERDNIRSWQWTFRFAVGRIESIAGAFEAFWVKGQGDTWEQAFAEADAKDKKAA